MTSVGAVDEIAEDRTDGAVATHDQAVDLYTAGLAPTEDSLEPFAGSNRLRPDGRPRPEFRAELRRIPNLRNAWIVVWTLTLPFLWIGGALLVGHPLGWLVAFVAMGTWFQKILTLHHEASHRLLFSRRWINDWVGEKFLGWLAFGDGGNSYRIAHANHHRDEFGEKEPDFLLYANYPISQASMRRKLLRDVSGVSGYKNLRPALKGLITPGRRMRGLRYVSGQVFVFGVFFAFGHPWLYLAMYLLPWGTYFRVFNRLRALAEHGGMTRSADRRRTTHNIRQGFLARHVFLTQAVGFHLAHHVDSGVPMANLPRLHRALVEDGYINEQITYRGYWPFVRHLVRADS